MADERKIVVYKLRMECDECGSAVFLNGPVRTVQCQACLSELKVPGDHWKTLLEDGDKEYGSFKPGQYQGGTLLASGRKYTYYISPEQPRCPGCREKLDIGPVRPGADQVLFCGHCGMRTTTFPSPDWLKEELPRSTQLFCAWREGESAEIRPDPASLRPVMMSCHHCGAGLRITSETQRIAACEYCDTDHYVPDDIWRRLHPVKKRSPWYLEFDAPRPAAKKGAKGRRQRPVRMIRCAQCGREVRQRDTEFTEKGALCPECLNR